MIERRRVGELAGLAKVGERARVAGYWLVRTARLMVGVPEYATYVERRRMDHPGKPVMTYEEFFRERQSVRYGVSKGRFKGCC